MDIAKSRLANYFKERVRNPMGQVMTHLVSNPDDYVLCLYAIVLERNIDLLPLADIFSAVYLAIRNVFSLPPLLNKPYYNSEPNTNLLMGEDIGLLGSMSIIVEANNEILRFISNKYPHRLADLDEIINRTVDLGAIKIFGDTPADNFKTFETTLMENYKFAIDWFLR